MEKKQFIQPELTVIEIHKDEIICYSNTADPDYIMGKKDFDIYGND